MYQHLMMFVIKIFHLQVNPFSGQILRWSFWTQPEPKGQILNLGEHMQITPTREVSSFNHSFTQLILTTLCVKHMLSIILEGKLTSLSGQQLIVPGCDSPEMAERSCPTSKARGGG